MTRPIRIVFRVFVLIAFLAGCFSAPEIRGSGIFLGMAQAQAAKKKRRSFFEVLFGTRKRVKKKSVKKRSKRKKSIARSKKKRSGTLARLSQAPKVVTVEKAEDAKSVLVIGDFFAGGLADGLVVALRANGIVKVEDKSRGLSGFVRSDVVDWPARAKEILEEVQPSYVVVLLGSNDRQLLRTDGKKLKTRSEEWDAEYQKRVNALAETLQQSRIPFSWVGLPSVRFASMNKDYVVFNEWYRKAATNAGGQYVDVWDGFTDAEGSYTRSGPDINGQIVLLRAKDGINLTKAGRRRLAYYVEGDIVKLLGGGENVPTSGFEDLSGVGIAAPRAPRYDPANSGKTVVIRLNEPSADGAGELAGAEINLNRQVDQPGAVPVSLRQGDGSPNLLRADNYSWPPAPPSATTPSETAENQ